MAKKGKEGKKDKGSSGNEMPSIEDLSKLASDVHQTTLPERIGPSLGLLHKTLEFSRAMSAILDMEELLRFLIERFVQFMEAERGFLVFISPDGKIEFQVCRDFEGRDILDPQDQVSTTVIEETIRSGRASLVQNALSDPSFKERPSIARLELLSVLCAPLAGTRQGVLGAIYLDDRSRIGRFTEEERDMLALLANQAGIAIENARLFEDLRAARTAAERAEKMKGAHEVALRVNSLFRATLARIVGHVQIMSWSQDPGGLSQGLGDIEQEARTGVAILRKLEGLDYSAKPGNVETVSLRGLIESSLDALPVKGLKCEITGDGAFSVQGNRHQLREAFGEILKNALEAMRNIADPVIEIAMTEDETSVEVAVKDHGQGMPAEVLAQAKDPFFTTKRDALGLGLTLADAMVYCHGGKVSLENQAGGGACVRVRLPKPPAAAGPAAALGPERPRARILLVDDEVEVADLLARTLAGQGHGVQVATTPQDAKGDLGKEAWDILMVDVGFPSAALEALVRSARNASPPPVIVFLSAWTEWPETAIDGVDMIATKPVQVRLLAQLVQEALGRRQGAPAPGNSRQVG